MLECLEAGELRPTAREVADRAGVSTRAVFRHFENMESLLEEVARLQIDRVLGQLPSLLLEGPVEDRVTALVARSTHANELVTPVRRAALLFEPFSELIRERHGWMRGEIRKQIRLIFAPELAGLSESGRRERVAALCALLSFSYWDELRRHERLSVTAARRATRESLLALLRT